MKKRVIKIAALVVLFAAVLVISNVILNRGNDDQVVDMGDATLPRVSFMMGGQKIVRFYDLDGNLIEVGTPM